MKKPKLLIIVIRKGEESHIHDLGHVFNQIIKENILKLKINIPVQI